MKRKTRKKLILGGYAILLLAIIFLVVSNIQISGVIKDYNAAYTSLQSLTGIGNYNSQHVHADFQVFVNGQEFDFNKPEYLLVHPLAHVESGTNNINLIHAHAVGITYGHLFSTIGVELGDCLTINDKDFCDTNKRIVKYYLNGKITPDLAHTLVSDEDKILISYGSESTIELQQQLNSIGDRACIQSGKC